MLWFGKDTPRAHSLSLSLSLSLWKLAFNAQSTMTVISGRKTSYQNTSGDSAVVRAQDSLPKSRGFESPRERRDWECPSPTFCDDSYFDIHRAEEVCESRDDRPGLPSSSLIVRTFAVDVKQHWTRNLFHPAAARKNQLDHSAGGSLQL